VLLVDRVQHVDDRTLNDLVLQRRYPDRPLSAVRLRYVNTSDRLRVGNSSSQPTGEICKVAREILAVALPCLAIEPWARISLESEICGAQAVDVVYVVKERSEPLFPV